MYLYIYIYTIVSRVTARQAIYNCNLAACSPAPVPDGDFIARRRDRGVYAYMGETQQYDQCGLVLQDAVLCDVIGSMWRGRCYLIEGTRRPKKFKPYVIKASENCAWNVLRICCNTNRCLSLCVSTVCTWNVNGWRRICYTHIVAIAAGRDLRPMSW